MMKYVPRQRKSCIPGFDNLLEISTQTLTIPAGREIVSKCPETVGVENFISKNSWLFFSSLFYILNAWWIANTYFYEIYFLNKI